VAGVHIYLSRALPPYLSPHLPFHFLFPFPPIRYFVPRSLLSFLFHLGLVVLPISTLDSAAHLDAGATGPAGKSGGQFAPATRPRRQRRRFFCRFAQLWANRFESIARDESNRSAVARQLSKTELHYGCRPCVSGVCIHTDNRLPAWKASDRYRSSGLSI